MNITVIFVVWLVTIGSCEIQRKYYLPYCTNDVVSSYKIQLPGKCLTWKNNSKTINGITVFKPFNRVTKLAGTACRWRVDLYDCTFYFFGAKSCILIRTEYYPTDRVSCILANRRHFTPAGVLLPTNDHTLQTHNILVPVYTWPKTNRIVVKNFIMATVEITKDVVENQFYDILLGRMSCDESTRSCLAGTWRVNYVDDQKKTCKNRPKVVDAALTIHTTSDGFLYEIKKANLITTTLNGCSANTVACLDEIPNTKFLCTYSGHVIRISKSSDIVTTNTTEVKMAASLRTIQQALATVSHGNNLNTLFLKKFIQKLTCETARASVVALIGSQQLNPSQVLSLVLDKEVQAVYSAGTLKKLRCNKVLAILQPTLEYKGHVSNRPLFRAYVGTKSVLTSLRQGRYLSDRISSTITPGTRKSFAFNNTVLIYENNTLTDSQPALQRISIKNIEIEEKFFDLSEENLNEDLEQVTGSEEDITKQQLKNLILLTQTEYESRGVNINNLLADTHKIDKETVAVLLTRAKSAFWPDVTNIVDKISHIYTVLISLFLVIIFVQTLKEFFINRQKSKDDPQI